MAEITNEIVEAAYEIAKEVYLKSLSHKEGLDILDRKHGMNRNSASDYIHNYAYLVEGRRFTRTTNTYGTRYYLKKIYSEGGIALLLNALSALRQHIDYYEVVGKTNVVARQRVYEEYAKIAEIDGGENSYPDEVNESKRLVEGKVKSVNVNVYERNPAARAQCIQEYGCVCYVCSFDFEKVFGELGSGFIHVHHEIELSSIGSEYFVNPISDLKPVCPNCHAMIHRKRPAISIAEIRAMLAGR